MKFLILLISLIIAVEGWKRKYGNDCVTYSIGERFDRGDFLIRNVTIESKCVSYHWPRVHRLEYRIQNHDDLLSFAQIDIIDTDEPHELHINTQSNFYDILVVSTKKIRGLVKIYHKAPANVHHLQRLLPSLLPQNNNQDDDDN